MDRQRERRFVAGVGWVKPKRGYVWTLRGNIRKTGTNLPGVWGSRKYGIREHGY